MTSPLAPIELTGTDDRLTGEASPLPDGFVERLALSCDTVTDVAETAEAASLGAQAVAAVWEELPLAADLEAALGVIVRQERPELLAEPGVGPITAATILNAWSHAGRLRSEAAFAMLAGVAPVEASSGQTVRHRLNRSGDRQLNRALHIIVLSRLTHDAETRAYAKRRTREGKTPREIKRCLKRHLSRRLFRLLEASARAA